MTQNRKGQAASMQLGIVCIIFSSIFFGMMPLLAKIAIAHGSTPVATVFWRFVIGSAILFVVLHFLPGVSIRVAKEQFPELIRLAILFATVPVMMYSSYTMIDSGLATTLHFTFPIFVALILRIVYHEKLSKKQILCILVSMLGIALLSTPDGQISLFGVFLAASSGAVYAAYIVLLGKSTVHTLYPLVLTFWVAFLSAIAIGIFGLLTGQLTVQLDATGWTAEVILALLTSVFAIFLFQRGVYLCGELNASLFSSVEPLTGIIIGILVFHEAIQGRELVGMVSILLAVILMALKK